MMILKKGAFWLFLVIIVLCSTESFASYMKVNATVPEEIVLNSSFEVSGSDVLKNEPILISVTIRNLGNQPVYSSLASDLDGNQHNSFIGFIRPLETIAKDIAVPSAADAGVHKLRAKIVSTNLRESEESEQRSYDITVRNEGPSITKKIVSSSDSALEIGQLNNILISLNNNFGDSLEDIYVYSTFGYSDTQKIDRIDDGGSAKINFQILVPKDPKEKYSIPIYVYDKKKDILSQSILEFDTDLKKESVQVRYGLTEERKIDLILTNNNPSISNLNLEEDYFSSLLSLKPSGSESEEITLLPYEERTFQIDPKGSDKIRIRMYSLEKEEIFSDTVYVDKVVIYLAASIAAFVAVILFVFYRKNSK